MSAAPDLTDPLIYARAIHFAATIVAAGAALFFVFLIAPTLPNSDPKGGIAVFRTRLLAIAWISLSLCLLSGTAWLVLTAQSMSGQPLGEVLSQGVIWTVLARTEFGNDWLFRLVAAVLLAITWQALLPAHRGASRGTAAASVALSAALVGSLAWAGHAIGASGAEGIVHPIADVLHLVAAAAWVGSLPLLVLLLAMTKRDPVMAAVAQTVTMRFSTLGIVSVGTLLATGVVNSWYLVGSVAALLGTTYGRLLSIKIALFLAMVAIAAVNRLRLTPRLARVETEAAAPHHLRRNAAIETLFGVFIVVIVAVMGTEPPASHAHHPVYGGLPADAAFVHIHSDQGMADVTIMPGRVGAARATIRLWDADFGPLEARQVTLALTAPAAAAAAGSKPITRVATQDSEGAWQVDDIALPQPGNWIAKVDAALGPTTHLILDAPIVIESDP